MVNAIIIEYFMGTQKRNWGNDKIHMGFMKTIFELCLKEMNRTLTTGES